MAWPGASDRRRSGRLVRLGSALEGVLVVGGGGPGRLLFDIVVLGRRGGVVVRHDRLLPPSLPLAPLRRPVGRGRGGSVPRVRGSDVCRCRVRGASRGGS